MTDRLRVDAPTGPRSARFLHMIQGADGGAAPDAAALLRGSAGTPYEGARVAGTAVLFPVDLARRVQRVVADVGAARRVLVTGLDPRAGYAATLSDGRLTVRRGGDRKTDAGGVLVVPG
jgi:hypothetical protein